MCNGDNNDDDDDDVYKYDVDDGVDIIESMCEWRCCRCWLNIIVGHGRRRVSSWDMICVWPSPYAHRCVGIVSVWLLAWDRSDVRYNCI